MKKALIIMDLQNDFLPGGALAIPNGDQVLPIVNKLLDRPFDVKVASKDWHPANHGSFAATHHMKTGEHTLLDNIDQILWPVHCVQGTPGAEFSKLLHLQKIEKVFYKGTETISIATVPFSIMSIKNLPDYMTT